MGKFSAWSLFLVVSLLAVKALARDELNLADALDEDDTTKAPDLKPKLPPTDDDLGLDFGVDDDKIPTKAPPKVAPKATKAPIKPKPKPDETQTDFFGPTLRPGLLPRSTRAPGVTQTPPRGQSDVDGFDLSDALDPNNDIGGKDKKGQGDKGLGGGGRGDGSPNNRGTGGSFSNSDLDEVSKDDSYKPDKGKGGRGGSGQQDTADDNNQGTMAETGTIAGIVSAVAMALVGAVTSYISYQKKKFCFSIQQSLNADPVKTDNPDAVVATEPQVQQTLLEPPNAEPPSEENAV